MIIVAIFAVVLTLALYLLFTSDSWVNRFIFIILAIYSLSRILNPFDIMPEITGWILQYLTLIALPLILLAVFIKSKSSKGSA